MAYDYHKASDSKFMTFIRDHFSEIVMVFTLVAFLLTAIYTFSLFKTENIRLSVDQIEKFNSGWIVKEIKNNDSSHTIIFKNRVPKDIENNSAIAFKSTDETVYIHINGELIYSYGLDNNFEKPINLGSHYILFDLPDDSSGKEIEISATYFGKQTQWRQERDFMIEGNDGIILRLIVKDLASILVCFVMAILSLYEILKSFFLCIKHQNARATLFLGLFILASANWLSSETILMQLLFRNAFVKYIIQYYSFLTLPCLFPMFAKEKLQRFNLPLAFAAVISWAYSCVSMLLFVILSIGFEKHLYVAHGLMAFVIAIVLICCILDRKNKQLKNLLVGTVVLAFFAIVSLYSYHKGYVHGLFSAYHFRDFFFAGMISFIVILLYDSYQQTAKDKEEAALSGFYRKSAYTDLLTQLGSRTAFTEDFNKTESDIGKLENVTIIMLDLNNLKTINDVKGHAVGDELIKSLASCLISVFGKVGKIYRIGGDEFVILILNKSESDIVGYLDSFAAEVDSQSNAELSGNSVAIGYSRRDKEQNTDLGIRELLKIADEKMYEDKSKKKGSVKSAR